MTATTLALADDPRIRLASELPERERASEMEPWSLAALAGQLVELSGGGAHATLTLACVLMVEVQRRGEPVAWVGTRESSFFPPDLAASGVDLEHLPVVFAPDAKRVGRAADRLLRSGGFGLVVLDLAAERPWMPQPLLARLAGLAAEHAAVALCLTRKPAAETSLGSLVSLRAVGRRERTEEGDFSCRLEAQKDKHRAPGWSHTVTALGPPGL